MTWSVLGGVRVPAVCVADGECALNVVVTLGIPVRPYAWRQQQLASKGDNVNPSNCDQQTNVNDPDHTRVERQYIAARAALRSCN